jgi:adenylate cyclase class 2
MAVETEIKLCPSGGAEAGRRLLEQHGFSPAGLPAHEIDQVYDFPTGELRQTGRLLRLRLIRKSSAGSTWLLTYKGPATPGRHKSREEIETGVSDGQALDRILTALGYQPSFRYEKYRTKFLESGEPSALAEGPEKGLVTLDETPIGAFLELEGPGYWIDRTAARLGFTPEQYITASYAALYGQYLQNNPLAPADMIFLRSPHPDPNT